MDSRCGSSYFWLSLFHLLNQRPRYHQRRSFQGVSSKIIASIHHICLHLKRWNGIFGTYFQNNKFASIFLGSEHETRCSIMIMKVWKIENFVPKRKLVKNCFKEQIRQTPSLLELTDVVLSTIGFLLFNPLLCSFCSYLINNTYKIHLHLSSMIYTTDCSHLNLWTIIIFIRRWIKLWTPQF